MAINFEEETKNLLDCIEKLEQKLKEIPFNRVINCNFPNPIPEKGEFIAKPRFQPANQLLELKIKEEFLHFKQHFLDYIENYAAHHVTEHILILFSTNSINSKKYKNSILGLLESDIWKTDEVYGDYLIRPINLESNHERYSSCTIHYHRRNAIRSTLKIPNNFLSFEELGEFICQDARKQIQQEFNRRWQIIKSEFERILVEYKNIVKIYGEFQPQSTLEATFLKGKKLYAIQPFFSLISLGYVVEMWLKNQIVLIDKYNNLSDLIRIAFLTKKISKSFRNLLICIRKAYNGAKHNPNYVFKPKIIIKLYKAFEKESGIIKNKK